MAQSNDMGDAISGTSWQKDAAPDRPPSKKKRRPSPPEVDCYLQMKWGLALLGEERSTEYLAWFQEKIGQKAQQ